MTYFIKINGEKQGPYSLDELKARNITQYTLVMDDTMQDWAEACTIPELNSLFESDSDSNNFTQMENDSEIDEKQSDTASDNDLKSDWLTKLKKNQTVLIIAAAVLLLFIITCPSKDSHKEAIVNEMNEAIDESMESDISQNEGMGGMAMLGKAFICKMLDAALDSELQVSNYGICSVGKIQYQGKTKTLSFGILGHVFAFGKDDIKKELNQKDIEE